MYDPLFNSVLVEIDDKSTAWGSGNDDSMLGKSYSKGTLIKLGDMTTTDKYSIDVITDVAPMLKKLEGKQIMWNEGTEAGTTFEHDGKQYGMIYWWDIRGVASAN